MPSLLPIFLKLEGEPVLLIGGGLMALEKLQKLLRTGAKLKLIARSYHPETRAFLEAQGLAFYERAWLPPDLKGQKLVIAALDDAAEHAEVAACARARGIWMNAVDDKAASDFYFAAQVERGPLNIAISTKGSFPGLARGFREWLEAILPDHLDEELQALTELRQKARAQIPNPAERMNALKEQLGIWLQAGLAKTSKQPGIEAFAPRQAPYTTDTDLVTSQQTLKH